MLNLFQVWRSKINENFVSSTGGVFPAMDDSSNVLRSLDFTTGTTSTGKTVEVTFTKPKHPISEYMLTCINYSTVTDITCDVYSVESSFSTDSTGCNSLVTSVSFVKEKTESKFIHGIFNGSNTLFSFSNDSTTQDSQGFTNYMNIKEVY